MTFSFDSLNLISSEKNLPRVPNSIAIYLLQDIEDQLCDLIRDSLKFMHHSKRERLTTKDINFALKTRNQKPLYGYDKSLVLRKTTKHKSLKSQKNMFQFSYLEDPVIKIKRKLKKMKAKKYPAFPAMSAHWIAIDGKKPESTVKIVIETEREQQDQEKEIEKEIEKKKKEKEKEKEKQKQQEIENEQKASESTTLSEVLKEKEIEKKNEQEKEIEKKKLKENEVEKEIKIEIENEKEKENEQEMEMEIETVIKKENEEENEVLKEKEKKKRKENEVEKEKKDLERINEQEKVIKNEKEQEMEMEMEMENEQEKEKEKEKDTERVNEQEKEIEKKKLEENEVENEVEKEIKIENENEKKKENEKEKEIEKEKEKEKETEKETEKENENENEEEKQKQQEIENEQKANEGTTINEEKKKKEKEKEQEKIETQNIQEEILDQKTEEQQNPQNQETKVQKEENIDSTTNISNQIKSPNSPSITNTNTNASTNIIASTIIKTNTKINTDTNSIINTNTNTNTGTKTNTDTDTNISTATNINTRTNTNANTVTNTDTKTNTDTDTNISTNTNINTNTNTNTKTKTNTDINTNTVTNISKTTNTKTNMNTKTNTNTNMGTNINTSTTTNTNTNTDLDPNTNTENISNNMTNNQLETRKIKQFEQQNQFKKINEMKILKIKYNENEIYQIPKENWKTKKIEKVSVKVISENSEDIFSTSTPSTSFLESKNNEEYLNENNKKHKESQLVKNVLSKELQLYYEKVISITLNTHNDNEYDEENKKKTIYNIILQDTGIQKLVPYFIQFILENVRINFQNFNSLFSLLRLLEVLIRNETLHMELYLHKVVPIVLTCLLSCEVSFKNLENNFQLRDYSARILSMIYQKYLSFPSLQPKITNVLINNLIDEEKDLISLYGAITGVSNLGLRVIKILIVPNVYFTYQRITSILKKKNQSKTQQDIAKRCKCLLLQIIASVVLDQTQQSTLSSQYDSSINSSQLRGNKKSNNHNIQKENTSNQEIFVDILELYEIFGDSLDYFLFSDKYHFTQILM
ncbi:taf6-like RNA polymerase ii p300/cbp-associated factor-associated factor [Anaeramoeba flamelloides]|uniref:Taf6-like RNA polymerase ii p300/cbp-associated factor-associated factor n=1 Tax=Anaeramoeba flamelloides TaxID=1746091 RepID=A0AAV8A8M4_9EUKA|nr:taf6-like RNA polymerase ii p300/cbp-associated factor-associated factor [Anaeramoeba flamelloides]